MQHCIACDMVAGQTVTDGSFLGPNKAGKAVQWSRKKTGVAEVARAALSKLTACNKGCGLAGWQK